MEGHCSTGQSPLRAVEPIEDEGGKREGRGEKKEEKKKVHTRCSVF
jgi:hypothetical protein